MHGRAGQPSVSLGRGHRVPHPVITKGIFITRALSGEKRLPGKGAYHIRKAFATGCAVATRPADECTDSDAGRSGVKLSFSFIRRHVARTRAGVRAAPEVW